MKNKPSMLVIGYTPDITGSSVALLRLLEAVESEIDFILAVHPNSHLYATGKQKGWKTVACKGPWLLKTRSLLKIMAYLFRTIHMSLDYRKIVRKHRPRICLVNCAPNIAWLPGQWSLPDRLQPQIVWLVHELVLKPEWVFRLIRRLVQGTSHKIMGVSHAVCRQYASDVCYLPNIVQPTKQAFIQNPFGNQKIHMLWVGTASPRKGLHLLVHKIKSLKSRGWNVRLDVVASIQNKYREYFKECLDTIRRIPVLINVVENTRDAGHFYRSNKIFIQTPTLPESFNLTALEAMSAGMLIFTSGQGGIEDFGRHGKNLFFWESLDKPFVKLIKELSQNKEMCRNIQQEAFTTAKRFSSTNITEVFVKEIKGIMEV